MKNNEIIHHRISFEDLQIKTNEIFRYLGYPLSKINELTESSIEMQMIKESILLMKMDIYTEEFHLQQKVILKVNLFYLIFLDYFQMQMY